jgi:hypothetical protein
MAGQAPDATADFLEYFEAGWRESLWKPRRTGSAVQDGVNPLQGFANFTAVHHQIPNDGEIFEGFNEHFRFGHGLAG